MLVPVVDTSAQPRAAQPRAMCYKCHNESNFPHHKAGPLRLGEGSKEEPGANAGSRLGESLLAWARCSLAQKSSRSPGRPFVQKGLGESLFVSPRRDWLAWARLAGLATVFLQQRSQPAHPTYINTFTAHNHIIPAHNFDTTVHNITKMEYANELELPYLEMGLYKSFGT
ncbi:hypothetical protein DEO72_LG6g1836 [Vigna unguiculata]|uniref:Uncharacterized protein n=1 Tax=Vigna unguiculata TaxID=3917 RepID=A0A4D6MAN1_VIGUN|nr:hypothetical protein DEO72_LG6g1836 [Vigna unguiculata]